MRYDQISRVVKITQKILGIEDKRIEINFNLEEILHVQSGEHQVIKKEHYAEQIELDTSAGEYLIRIFIVGSKDDLIDTVVHEIIHILFEPMTSTQYSLIDISGFSSDKGSQIERLCVDREHEVLDRMLPSIKATVLAELKRGGGH